MGPAINARNTRSLSISERRARAHAQPDDDDGGGGGGGNDDCVVLVAGCAHFVGFGVFAVVM